MSLSDHLVSTIRRDRIEEILEQLEKNDPVEHEVLSKALEQTAEYSGGDIARALNATGHDVTANQVNHYRRKKGYNQ